MDLLNDARNQAKHANNSDEETFDVEQIHPLQMIMRAMSMAHSLGTRFENEGEMVAWIRAHPEAVT